MNEAIPRFSAGGVVYKDGKILTINWLSKNSIEFPKGNIEPGETCEVAAVREVGEETGYQTEIIQSLGSVTFEYIWTDGIYYRKTVDYFLMKLLNDDAPMPNREVGEDFENYWVTADEAKQLLTHEDSKEILARAVKAIQQNNL